jgi:ketosteroid isomerase-like protein
MRKQVFLSLALLLAVLATSCCVQPIYAQSDTMAKTTIRGTWFGNIAISTPDGKISHDTAVLVIGQVGSDVTSSKFSGGMGRTIDQLTPWVDGGFKDNQLKFHLDAAGGLDVSLTLKEGRLAGTATGQRINAQIDLKPAPGLLPYQQLQQEIMEADRKLYAAFENCDVVGFASFFSKDLEFYHDRTGKTDYAENLKALQNRCAEGIRLRRELEQDSLIVNAAPGFGAIEAGVHRFYSQGKDGQEHLDATARFTNVWSKESGSWKLVRVISYDHR